MVNVVKTVLISKLDLILFFHFLVERDVSNDFVLPFDFNFEWCGLSTNSECCRKCFN